MAIFANRESSSGPIAVLDVGTSKVCCVIAQSEPPGLTLLGLGHQRSRGVKSGMIVDAGEAERAVRSAVGQAERMAGVSLESIAVAVNCGRLRSQTFTARAPVDAAVVRDADVARILGAGEAYLDRSGRSAIQLMRTDWLLDGAAGIADPRGLAGRELAVELTAVTGDDGPVRNLLGVVERSHLATERLAAAPYASALATATEEERRLGTLVVEMGAGLTSFAAFADGRLLHIDSVPVGGNHVTFDIARALVTSVQEAERIKTLYGTLVKAASNDTEVFAYPVAGEDEGAVHQTSKAFVAEIVGPRIDALIDLVLERIAGAGLAEVAARQVVLTGGASQLLGLDRAWSARLGCVTRVGRPHPLARMPASLCSPAFSTAIGLLGLAAEPRDRFALGSGSGGIRRERGYLDRIERWIKESF